MLLPSLSLLVLATHALAHHHPESEHEKEVQRALQVAAYHCAPAIEQLTAARKRSWAQKVLAGNAQLPGYDDLFKEDTYADVAPGRDQKLLSCVEADDLDADRRNNSCVLAPVVTEGPYYHTAGHPIRQNIAEMQFGLLTLLDIQVIDVETCKPLPNVLVDIWHANATGHYAGHPVPKPGLENEKPQVGGKRAGLLSAYPRTVEEETWLRGAWPTDRRGVAQFTTIFPGYYTGRAVHVHVKVYPEWEVLPNNTFVGGRLSHVGQMFFDDDVEIMIDKMWPYSTNPIRDTWGRTRNWRDSLNIFEDSHGPESLYNPVFKLDFLGSIINQGVIGYITMAVNASASYDNFWKG